jgi:hypothetical protein
VGAYRCSAAEATFVPVGDGTGNGGSKLRTADSPSSFVSVLVDDPRIRVEGNQIFVNGKAGIAFHLLSCALREFAWDALRDSSTGLVQLFLNSSKEVKRLIIAPVATFIRTSNPAMDLNKQGDIMVACRIRAYPTVLAAFLKKLWPHVADRALDDVDVQRVSTR